MPYKAKRPCRHRGCPELTDQGYCDQHRREECKRYNRFDRDPGTTKRYGNQDWRTLRAQFLAANPLCEICESEGIYKAAELVHHKIKITAGGTNSWGNLQALCSPCHSRLHSKAGDYFPRNGGNQ